MLTRLRLRLQWMCGHHPLHPAFYCPVSKVLPIALIRRQVEHEGAVFEVIGPFDDPCAAARRELDRICAMAGCDIDEAVVFSVNCCISAVHAFPDTNAQYVGVLLAFLDGSKKLIVFEPDRSILSPDDPGTFSIPDRVTLG